MNKNKTQELETEIKNLEEDKITIQIALRNANSHLKEAYNIMAYYKDNVEDLIDNIDLHDGEGDFQAITYGEAFTNAMESKIEQIKEDLPNE